MSEFAVDFHHVCHLKKTVSLVKRFELEMEAPRTFHSKLVPQNHCILENLPSILTGGTEEEDRVREIQKLNPAQMHHKCIVQHNEYIKL
jgi:hypothetical protein